MRKKGKLIKCKYCGKEWYVPPASRKKFCDKKCYAAYMQRNPPRTRNYSPRCGSNTLCWTCKHTNQNECSWFTADLIPVPGWKAIERPVEGGMSYIVLECPNYEREEIKR
jgi:hypothetical protein